MSPVKIRWKVSNIVLLLSAVSGAGLLSGTEVTLPPDPAEYCYQVRFAQKAPASVEWNDPRWGAAETGRLGNFYLRPGINTRFLPETRFKVLYDRAGLYVLFTVYDRFMVSRAEHQGAVWRDSCVEFFFQPPGELLNYFNVEINRGGSALVSYSRNAPGELKKMCRVFWTPAEIEAMQIRVSHPGKTIDVQAGPDYWSVSFFLPFRVIEKYTGVEIKVGVTAPPWRGNFYKICSDEEINPHWASWARLSKLSFHRPTEFGYLFFDTPSE
mgnify:CR=1 FL=1